MAVKRYTKGPARKSIQVCAHWQGLENPILMGTLYAASSLMILIGGLLVATIQSCSTVTPHENFKNIFNNDIGKRADDPSSIVARYPEWFAGSQVLPNGNTENKYQWKDDCVYFYEIEKNSRIIVGWHFEGTESACEIVP